MRVENGWAVMACPRSMSYRWRISQLVLAAKVDHRKENSGLFIGGAFQSMIVERSLCRVGPVGVRDPVAFSVAAGKADRGSSQGSGVSRGSCLSL